MAIADLFNMETGAEEKFRKVWLGYTETEGDTFLREHIAGLYSGIDPNEILVHSGAEEAIFNAMNVILSKDDHVIVHYPCYQSLLEVATSIGCEVTLWETFEKSNWSLDLGFLKDHIRSNTKLVVINCPHNPTGYLMPRGEFEELVNIAQKYGLVIFSDEVYRFLEYDEKNRLPGLSEIDDSGVSLGVMSKSFGLPGLRIGWIATRNTNLYHRLAAFKDYTTICNSAPSEFLATVALKNKNRIVERNLKIIQNNLAILDEFFGKYPQTFTWKPPRAGPIAFPSLKTGDIQTFCHDLVNHSGVLLAPGALYGVSDSNFRIGFGRTNLDECIEKLDEYLQMT
jgi:aspartate/methionine/tyrosine aminotransferase